MKERPFLSWKKISLFMGFVCFFSVQARPKIIIDADTGNEVDDLYAIVRALIEPDWQVLGLNAAQWQVSHWAVENTMEDSYRLNQLILSYLKLSDQVVSNRGAESRLYDWGNRSRTSQASSFIVQKAKETEDEKLIVIVLGALTNVASAILDDPSIVSQISIYWLGTRYDFEQHIMSNTDFNSVMDIQAVDVVLNSEAELHIIPGNVSGKMGFDYGETAHEFKNRHGLLDFLLNRWFNHADTGRYERVLWDVALIEAMIHPELAREVQIQTSKEKGSRTVFYYQDIDAAAMRQDFFKSVLKALQKSKD